MKQIKYKYTRGQYLIAKERLTNPHWRINNLYKVVDKTGNKVTFKLNWAQEDLYRNTWYCNIVLKARQLGMSTYVGLLFLDRCFFNDNMSAGIIAHTREDAEILFRRIKLAYEEMPKELKAIRPAVVESARELKFNNGSSVRVGTSMRSSTLNYLHVSEFGKICAHYPEKAEEIITGSLNTLAPGQFIFIESTAEGAGSYFYDMCQLAQKHQQDQYKLGQLDFKFHFYPWWKEPGYILPQFIQPNPEIQDYFNKLEMEGINLSGAQQAWYIKKYEILGDNIFSEFPSTPQEAFQTGASGLFYGKLLTTCRMEKRIGNVPYDTFAPVHTAWDLGIGVSGYSAIWFFQICGREIHLIDFYQTNGLSLTELIAYVKQKPYVYGEHLMPHDIGVHEFSYGHSRLQVARNLGIEPIIANKDPEKPVLTVVEGVETVKSIFPRCWFDEKKCKEGILALESYRKEWDDRLAKWSDKPVKDTNCHAADAFRMMAVGLRKMSAGPPSVENDMGALIKYWGT